MENVNQTQELVKEKSIYQKTKEWFEILAETFDPDPREYYDNKTKALVNEVIDLKKRLNAIEIKMEKNKF